MDRHSKSGAGLHSIEMEVRAEWLSHRDHRRSNEMYRATEVGVT